MIHYDIYIFYHMYILTFPIQNEAYYILGFYNKLHPYILVNKLRFHQKSTLWPDVGNHFTFHFH